MKKILLICLILILSFSLSNICLASTTGSSIIINDEQNAGSFVYPDYDPIPGAGATTGGGVSSLILADESVPKALPKTGGVPEEAFYAVGAILIIGALVILTKKTKTAPK